MSKILVRNISFSPITLPAPYHTILPSGGVGIIDTNKALLLAQLGGLNVTRSTLRLTIVPDSSQVTIFPITAAEIPDGAVNTAELANGAVTASKSLTATPVTTGIANNRGAADSLSRSDHVHRTALSIQEDGVVVAARPTINFVGGTTQATDDDINDRINVAVTASAPIQEQVFAPALGQTMFTLASAWAGTYAVVYVNGIEYARTTDFTIAGITLTWLNTLFSLDVTDRLVVNYAT